MIEAVRFPLESGGEILARVESPDQYGGVITRGGREYIQGAIEPGRRKLRVRVADAVLSQLTSLAAAPEEVEVEFGLELTAKARTVLTAAGASAPLRVALKWTRTQSDEATRTHPSGAAPSSSRSGSP